MDSEEEILDKLREFRSFWRTDFFDWCCDPGCEKRADNGADIETDEVCLDKKRKASIFIISQGQLAHDWQDK